MSTPTPAYHTVKYNDIRVSYLPELDGGGMTFGQQFLDVVRNKFGRVEHVFEFCAGPGFIGFSLLANGLCDRLTVADVNPAAVRACQQTIRENHLEDRVKVYESDCLDEIPETEKWDLVVSNPPHFDGTGEHYKDSIRLIDPGFVIHKKFYASVAKFLKPSGSIVFQENAHATHADEFTPMIAENGLKLVEIFGVQLPEKNAAAKLISKDMQRRLQKLMLPVERLLMIPSVEKLIKDNDVYRKLSSLPIFVPKQFYFMWSQAVPQPAVQPEPKPKRASRKGAVARS